MNTQRIEFRPDPKAPVAAWEEIEIMATPDEVWQVMAAIEDWPTWNPDVRWTELKGDLVPGTRFHWKSGPGVITSTLQQVERPRLLAWTGAMLGIRAVHIWRITALENGNSLVRTEESWDGLLVRLLRGSMQKTLAEAIHNGLRHLKVKLELNNASSEA